MNSAGFTGAKPHLGLGFRIAARFFSFLYVLINHCIVDASTLRQLAFGICWGLLPG